MSWAFGIIPGCGKCLRGKADALKMGQNLYSGAFGTFTSEFSSNMINCLAFCFRSGLGHLLLSEFQPHSFRHHSLKVKKI